jgi:ribonuclease HI
VTLGARGPVGDPTTGVFTDGSATPNPGVGGWGAVYVVDDEIVAELNGGDPATTNNRMELTALLRGIELVPTGLPVTLFSDSQLAVRTLNEWAPAWEARGWRRSSGPVENLDLVRPLFELVRARPELSVQWIRAHVGHRWNEYADRLAAAGYPR